MRVTIRDVKTLNSIRPADLVEYLRSHGWQQTGEKENRWSRWEFVNEKGEFEIIVPLDVSVIDYHYRIADAMAALDAVEQRSQLEILEDIRSPRQELTLCGQVVDVERKEHNAAGRVTVVAKVDDEPQQVHLVLSGSDFQNAISAHDRQFAVRFRGVLQRNGADLHVSDVRDFVVEAGK